MYNICLKHSLRSSHTLVAACITDHVFDTRGCVCVFFFFFLNLHVTDQRLRFIFTDFFLLFFFEGGKVGGEKKFLTQHHLNKKNH